MAIAQTEISARGRSDASVSFGIPNRRTEVEWRDEDCEYRVSLSPDAVAALVRESAKSPEARTAGGPCAVGLVFGSLEQNECEWRARIDEVAVSPAECRFGFSEETSEADERAFIRLMEINADRAVVGWYRTGSELRQGPAETDRVRSAMYFPQARSVFMTLCPNGPGIAAVRIHLWSPGQKENGFEFRLESATPPRENLPAALPPGDVPGAATRLDAPRTAAWRKTYTRWLLGAAVSIAGVAGGALLAKEWIDRGRSHAIAATGRPDPAARNIGLGLRIMRQGEDVLISWNQRSAEILDAEQGTITISGSHGERVVKMTPHELRVGSLLYRTPGSDTRVQMEITTRSSSFAQRAGLDAGGGTAVFPDTPEGSEGESVRMAAFAVNEPPHLVPARPLQSIQPVVSQRQAISLRRAAADSGSRAEVHIQVTVDEKGSVKQAAVQRVKGAYASPLTDHALDAARRWKFTPATLDGQPVQSHVTLVFALEEDTAGKPEK
ncbi:MAG TPA: TonB family protein [Bryobacteraceae bacterium]|nr:TonB family protein [Bryobacteraceae bacterium]